MQTPPNPDFYLSQGPTPGQFTPALNYQQIVIPLNGLDYHLTRRLADLLELSLENTEQEGSLNYILDQTFQQFGDCFDPSHITFMSNLQGNINEAGNVPGYPSPTEFGHTPLASFEKWSQYVALFRYFALEIYRQYVLYTSGNPTCDFIFHKRMPNGMVFYVTPRKTFYTI